MINRDVFKDSILELFRLFVPSGKGSRDDIGDSKDEADGSAQGLGGDPAGKGDMVADLPHSAVAHPSLGLGVPLMLEMSGQVSAGMWRVLTTNLEVLPTLSLSQWQVIFDVIAVCAGAGGYASIKAFESMAWMLHESRLQGEIPMFCTVGIRPLLCNNRTTISVSVGAIKLLTHLHSRLEVKTAPLCGNIPMVDHFLSTALECPSSHYPLSLPHFALRAGALHSRGRLCTSGSWRYLVFHMMYYDMKPLFTFIQLICVYSHH